MSKVISQLLWFCIATVCDWLKNLAPLSQPIRSKTKTNRGMMHAFSCAWRQLHVFASCSDWFIGLSACVVIGQNNYFGFGFTKLNCKPLMFLDVYFGE